MGFASARPNYGNDANYQNTGDLYGKARQVPHPVNHLKNRNSGLS